MDSDEERKKEESLIEDRAWVKQTLAGDQAAFGDLVNKYQNAVYNLAYRMLSNPGEAEDAAQEALMRAYTHLASYDQKRSFKTWLLSITSNYCIDLLRKRRLIWLSIDEPLPPHPALRSPEKLPESAALDEEMSAQIEKLLDVLPPGHRTAIVLRYWYELSYAEIAEVLDTTESAIKSRLFRARRMLADALEPQALSDLNPLLGRP